MSFYAKRMVDVGLLGEFYDEPSGRWKIDADGSIVRVLYDRWREGSAQPHLDWPAECPLDASLIGVWAFLLAFRDPVARAQLMSPARVRGGPPAHEVTVMGGYLMRLIVPLRGPDGQMQPPALPNFIDLYLQMLEQMISERPAGEPTGVATRRMRRGGAGQYTED